MEDVIAISLKHECSLITKLKFIYLYSWCIFLISLYICYCGHWSVDFAWQYFCLYAESWPHSEDIVREILLWCMEHSNYSLLFNWYSGTKINWKCSIFSLKNSGDKGIIKIQFQLVNCLEFYALLLD